MQLVFSPIKNSGVDPREQIPTNLHSERPSQVPCCLPMQTKYIPPPLALPPFALSAVPRLTADTVETKNGARIIGKISKIDAGTVEVDTDFAGTVKIKQSEVTTISTDAPIAIRLSSGTRMDGRVTAAPGGTVQIAGADGTLTTSVSTIAASWAAGKVDPAVD